MTVGNDSEYRYPYPLPPTLPSPGKFIAFSIGSVFLLLFGVVVAMAGMQILHGVEDFFSGPRNPGEVPEYAAPWAMYLPFAGFPIVLWSFVLCFRACGEDSPRLMSHAHSVGALGWLLVWGGGFGWCRTLDVGAYFSAGMPLIGLQLISVAVGSGRKKRT